MAGNADRGRTELPLRRPRWAIVLAGFLLLVLLIFVVIWSQRRQLASDLIQRELNRRGVQATYEVTRIGFRTERIANVVIGDPRRPDLSAEWVEIKIRWTLNGPKVGPIKARGVRMFGRIVDGQLSLGQVDRLLPPKSGAPFRFPNQYVDVADAALALDTEAGRIVAAVEGKGNLAYGFGGVIAARSTGLLLGGCAVDQPRVFAKVRIDNRQPSVDGPVEAQRILCEDQGVDLLRPQFALRGAVSESLDVWKGTARLEAPAGRLDRNRVRGLGGRLTFQGTPKRTEGIAALVAGGLSMAGLSSGRAAIQGRYQLAPERLAFRGDVAAGNVKGLGAAADGVAAALDAVRGTPVEPVADALGLAMRRAAADFDARARVTVVNGPGYGAVRVDELAATSRSGARLGATGPGTTYYWKEGRLRLNGDFGLSGGGFPASRVSIAQPRSGGPLSGEARIAPYRAGNASLTLAPLRFTGGSGGITRVETSAIMTGPIPDGWVQGLAMPIRASLGNGGFRFGEGCFTARFRGLQLSSLNLGPGRLPVCPTGPALVWRQGGDPVQGGADLRSLRLVGQLGGSLITLTARNTRVGLARADFKVDGLTARLGEEGSVSLLTAGGLSGKFVSGGITGDFNELSGKVGNVPILVSRGIGRWSLLGGKLAMDGDVIVSDDIPEPRFYPLLSRDFRLTLVNNRIEAGGMLEDPDSGTQIVLARVRHNLGTGAGQADLDVAGIDFDPAGYQPEQLTRLTTGVVALVDGVFRGQGQINWDRNGSTSNGTFFVEDMDLAAPFGPVEGLTTTIRFTDLLGLTTAPGQVANVDLIQTGIDVVDGTIRYQILPDLKVKVESGIWPFMGGQLVLEETILDFSKPSTKRLVFRAIGLDGATFVQQMEFANIELTGTFDGVLPMEFDERGGRIVEGRLSARQPGGTLSYVGELTDKQLGTFGKMAFDALKSFRYKKLDIGLSGSLDGEFLAAIELDGVGRNTSSGGGIFSAVLSQLARLPLEFNINISGPFRALIGTARSFSDPTDLIQPVLPEVLQGRATEVIEQDEDKETTTTGEPEPQNIPLIQGQESEGER